MLQRDMDVGFVGGAEIDEFGNINTTVIGNYERPKVRFPGSGGGNDILSHAKRILIITKHEKQRFPKRCTYITSPGYLGGPDERARADDQTPDRGHQAGRHGDQSATGRFQIRTHAGIVGGGDAAATGFGDLPIRSKRWRRRRIMN
jgi:hypothetical protein